MSVDILDYTFGPLLKTGQTDDLSIPARTSKDDGALQRGINKSKEDAQYVVLTTGQYSGTTDITVNAKTDTHSNECVYDKSTNLMWSRTQSASVFGTGVQDLHWDDSGASDEDIFEYCDQANLANLSGFNDWRIPNIDELLSLILYEGSTGAPNSTAFPVWDTTGDWSSTTTPGASISLANYVRWSNGTGGSRNKAGSIEKCVLVRLGIEPQ